MADLQQRGQAKQLDHQADMAKVQLQAQEMQTRQQQTMIEMQQQVAELSKKLAALDAEIGLKEAQRLHVLEQALSVDIENDLAESGVIDAIESLEEVTSAQRGG